jgi:hypothetical protein
VAEYAVVCCGGRLPRCVALPHSSSPTGSLLARRDTYASLSHKHFLVALVFILVYTLTQLFALARLRVINTHDNLATQLAAKSGAALSVLHFLHSRGVACARR